MLNWHRSHAVAEKFSPPGIKPAPHLVRVQNSNHLTKWPGHKMYFKNKSVVYSSRENYTVLDFCKWLADDSTITITLRKLYLKSVILIISCTYLSISYPGSSGNQVDLVPDLIHFKIVSVTESNLEPYG